ncbi:MAG: GEVED domain-containing protein, partial [Planctomycetaceae bacterium]|nr:GEVED domain-containing protein [Planctomycetaceae bacterium]
TNTFQLNSEQGNNITDALLEYVPEHVVIPEALWEYQVTFDTSLSNTLRQTAVQSFGFWFEFGGQRYNSYIICDNGRIGLVNANGYVDASIELGIPYVSTTPTVDVNTGVSVRGNNYVQIRWNSAIGLIIENDPAGDIVSFFYADSSAYPNNGVDLGGPNANTHVYTDFGNSFVGFRYSDGSSDNILPGLIGKEYIQNQQDFLNYVKAIGDKIDFRMNIATGQVGYYPPGLSSVVVTLEFPDGNTKTTYTDFTGYYEFPDIVDPGTYTVSVGAIAGDGWISIGPDFRTVEIKEIYGKEEAEKNLYDGNDFSNIKIGSVSILDTTVVKGLDGKTYANIEVVLRDYFGAPLTFTYETQDGSAKDGTDYKADTGTVTVYPQLAQPGQWTVKTAIAEAPAATYSQSVSGYFMAYEVLEKNQWKVYIHDVRSGETFCLTDMLGQTGNNRAPSILQTEDGNLHIVWTSYYSNAAASQIHYATASIDDLNGLTMSDFKATKEGTNTAPQISSYMDAGKEKITIAWQRGNDIYFETLDKLRQEVQPEPVASGSNVIIDGKNIVWLAVHPLNGRTMLQLYNMESGTTINLPEKLALAGSSSAPTISGDYVAWVQTRSSTDNTTKIMYYQISTEKSFDIKYGYSYSDYTLELLRDIYDNNYDIFYWDFPTFDDFLDYYGYLLEPQTNQEDVYRGGQAPCLDGEWLVWQEPNGSGGAFNVWAYNIKTQSYARNISVNNTDNDMNPQVVGNLLVWHSRTAEAFGDTILWQIRFVDLSIDGFIPRIISESAYRNFEPLLTNDMVAWRAVDTITNKTSIQVATREVADVKATIQIEILAGNTGVGNENFSVILTGVTMFDLTEDDVFISLIQLEDLPGKIEANVEIYDNYGTGKSLNYGTAPASYGTLPEDDGARHVVTPLRFGSKAVQFLGDWTPGSWVCIQVDATAQSALNLWVDWNGNGRFDETDNATNEHVKLYYDKDGAVGDSTIQLMEGVNTLWLWVPSYAKPGQTYARFRITSEAIAQDTKWYGIASDGEVKDYAVQIVKPRDTDSDQLVYVDKTTNTLVVRGTAMEKQIEIKRDGDKIYVTYPIDEHLDPHQFSISNDKIAEVRVDGYTGRDSVIVTGWKNEEHDVLMNPYNAVITSDTLKITISNVSNISYVGTSGLDLVKMWDSAGNDTVVLKPNEGNMTGPSGSFVNTVANVSHIVAYSARGGDDTLTMTGSSGADLVTSWEDSIVMYDDVPSGANHAYFNRGIGFTGSVIVNAGAGTKDVATIIERIDASVRLAADPETAKLYRGTGNSDTPELTFVGFNSVVVTAQGNTKLAALLTGSDGNDTLVASDSQVILSGTNYRIEVNHFANSVVDAGAGKDTATFTSGTGGEHLTMLDDRKTFELYGNDNLMDDALLKLIAFESIRFDAAKNKCTANDTIANLKKNALIDIDLIGDWVQRNR